MKTVKIKIVRDFKPNPLSGWIKKGEEYEARRLTLSMFDLETPYQIIEGEHSGIDVPFKFAVVLPLEQTYSEAEYNAINQELLQRREEVRELTQRNDLQKVANRELLEQIRRMEEGRKPVVLSQEVAAALDEVIPKNFGDKEYVAWIIAHHGEDGGDKFMKLLQDEANRGSFFKLIDAIRYGYTVKEPPKPLEDELTDIVDYWLAEPNSGDSEEECRRLVDRILEHIKQREQKERVS